MVTCRTLIVDDDRDDLDLLCSSFHEIGAKEVNAVESVQEAIECLQNADDKKVLPKLIVTDLNMPGQCGYELLKILKTTPLYMHIPVIIFSTSISEKEIKKSLSLGALDYIPKPILIEDYIDLVSKMNKRITGDY